MKKLILAALTLVILVLTSHAAYNAGFYAAIHAAEPMCMDDGTIDIDFAGEIHKYWR